MIFLTKSVIKFTKALIALRHLGVFFCFVFFLSKSTVNAQAFCNNPLGSLAPNLTWQYQSHTALGYYTFNATAGCTYQFTYCNSVAPSASYSGDTYITISNGIVTGALVTNDDYCGLGSYLSWTAPSTGLFYFNVGNCCSPQCGAIATRTFGYRSTNCAGTTPAPTGITSTSNTICSGQSVTLTAVGAFGTQYWYTGSCGGAQVGTGATLTVSPNATTTYFVNNNNGGQFSPSCASITITVNPSPPAPTVSGTTVFCGPSSTTLTASGGANYSWYSNATATSQVGTGPSFITPTLNTTTTYYVLSGSNGSPPGTITFNYTGAAQTWVVPNGVTSVSFTLRGAKGGNGNSGLAGGNGATITGNLAVTPGSTLNIYVGGQGAITAGGFNGGGNGGSGAGGGGGASDIRVGGAALANRAVVAAGGGGTGQYSGYTPAAGAGGAGTFCASPWGYGGAPGGGCATGGIGGCAGGTAPSYGTGGAGGGLTSGGGTAGAPTGVLGGAGSLGQGGNGGTSVYGAGGGGGGYYGGSAGMSGSGGCHGGGGGGSSFANTTIASGLVHTAGNNAGNGSCILSWLGTGCPSAIVPVTITINPSPTITVSGTTICSGQTTTLTATTNMPGGTFTWSPGNLTGASINVSPNATTQYTVSYTLAGCGTVTATATVTVNPSPASPTANNVTLCGPGIATLTATGGQNNNYTWYSNSNGTGQLVTGASYTTPTISTTTTYYVGTTAQGGTLTGTQTFNYTGGVQTFTAPATGNYSITLNGGRGGNGLNTTGGLGGQATGSLALTAGQTISVYIGGQGGNSGGPVGWNGGGQGGLDVGAGQHAGSGGGASDIRVGGTALANRVIVAGGGAGGGRDGTTGVGGGTSGTTSTNNLSGYGGTGGTQVAGGVAWTLTRGATNGTLGIGGAGSTGYNAAGGGGGGGGYYGGGGGTSTQDHGSGWSAGGGGGSSYIGGVVGGTTTQGVQNGNGSGTISWNIVTIGCPSALTPVTVTVNPVPVVTVTNATVCAGQQAILTATSTVPGGTFTWSPGGTTGPTITVTPNTTTTYTATYTVAGCPPVTGTGTVTINPFQPITGTLTACLGLTSQLANAVTPGTWSSSNTGVATISGTGLVTGVSAGTSTITYNASNGCSTTSQFTVYPQPVLTATPSNVLCFGGTGSVSLSASGANAPYTYGGSPTQNLQPGTYTYTATSVNGCVSAPVSITITQPQAQLALSTTQVNVLCSGNNTGSINLTVTGGTAPYTYAWSNNTTQEDPTNLASGTYTVTVTDANGCTSTTTVTITQPQAPLALATTQVNVLCFGNSTGSVNLTVTGGTAPYTYAWSNNTTQEDPTNLASGTYTVTVTDANGCTAQTSVTITQPQAGLALSTTQVNVLCFGNSTGSVNLTVTGGTAPYTYLWSNQGTAEDPTGMAAGAYTVTVTDANGCTAQTSVTITQPQAGLALSTTQVNVLCSGNNTGSINLTVTGGTAPYTYAWSNNTTQEDPTGLASGTYTVTVTDANGCTSTTTVTITQPQAPLALATTQVNVLCFGNSTGSIDLTPTGGTSPYTYSWSNNTTLEDPTGLASGTYTVTVTDANGCTATTTVTITQPQAPLALATTQVNVLCFGNSTGSIDLIPTGGTAPYTYAWSNNTTLEDPTGLASGTYTVTATDANGCTAQTSVTITQPQAPLALATTQVNVLCFGNSTGSIDLTPTGGTSPYTYAWSNNTTLEDPTGLASGTYTVTVTDANGCTTTQTVTITQPQAGLVLTTTQTNVGCFGNNTGAVDLTVTGGTAPYSYLWSNNGTAEDPTGMIAGAYTVTVTDANGCTSTTTVTITQPQAPLALTTTQTNVGCFGNNTGAVDLTVTGGTAPYAYAWSNNTTLEDPTGLASGTYTVTVTDANGCTSTTTVTITQPQAPLALATTQVNVLCFGNSTGSINLTPTGGTAPYTYAWSNNTTQEDPTGLVSGTYTVTVTDANGCTAQTIVTITQPQAPLALATTQVNVLCFGNSTGSVNLTVTGGTAPYTYLWSNQGTAEDPTGMAAGAYTVTVTDANGCTAQTSVTITQPQAGLALSTTQVNVLCSGNNTGSINLTVTGGTAPYSYLWSNNGTAEDPTGMIAGAYTVTVTDANGCTSTTTVTITQPQAALALSTTQVNVLCSGNNTGSINLTVTGGTAPYTYVWSNNTTQEDPTGLAAGTYTVTVTDANGCTAQTSVTITQPQAPLALATTQVNVLCFGNSTGSVNLTVTGGTAPYTYAWSNNTTQEDPTNLASGTYTVTVTDANGCTAQTSVTITQPQAGLALSTSQVNVLCSGNNTGSINLTVTGGTAPYSYLWSNNGTAEDPTGMIAGAYTVTVTDANGCTSTTTVTITQPQAALALSTTQVNVLCFGNSTGSIDLTPTGGTAPYTYAWSNNTILEDPTGLVSGTYTVTVTDANGCTAQTSVTITQPQAPLALTTTQTNVGCFGNNTGAVDLTVTGGTAPYTYAWSNNTILEDPTGLVSGTYTVTVTDANGCTAQTSVTITQPQAALALSTTQVNVLCFGNSTGSIDLTPTGGTAPYTYAWSNNTILEDPTGLVSGTYTVTVTDANGCTAQTSVTITQPQAPLALTTTQTNVGCFGNNTGAVDLTVTGGTAPYAYAWSNNTTLEDPTGLASGTYTVTVTDANGCTSTTTVTITQPQAPLALATTQVNVLCFGNSTGSINLTPTGGTAPYTYAWSNNTTQEDPTGLVSGTYTVTVTDANGCTAQTIVTITQPQAPLALATTQVNVLCFGNSTGSVNLTVTGGTAPYTYAWSNNTTQEDPTGLVSGTYTVTVTDANGCTAQTIVTITQPQAPLALATTQVNVLCFGNSTGSVNLTVTGGTAPYTYAWSNNTTLEDPTNLASGTYTVTVTDANGCTAQTSVTITQPQAPLALSTTQVNVLCFGNSTGSVNLTVTGGTAPYTYLWSNQGTAEDPTGMAAGAYTVTVTDANGCTAQTSVTITQPQAPLALSTTQVNVLCFGNSTGSVNLTVTGGTAPYTYLWSNQGTAEDPTGMAAGAYTVTVTDANGCTAQTSVTITQPQAGLALSTTQVNVLCSGNNTGSINLTVTGGTAPYTYAWSNNTTQEDPTNLASGTYTVTVTDANGCTAQTSVTITQPQAPLALATTQVNVLCFGNSTGSINLTPTGGTAPYTYAWSNNTTQEDPTGLVSGTYTVTVTDANGCTATTTVTITQPQAPLALATTQVNVLCFGNSTGSVNLTVTGGTAPYTYAWSNNTTQEDPTNLASGTYTVTVTDANGCTAQTSVTITQPQAGLALSTTQVNVLCFGNSTGSVNLTVTGGTAPYTYLWSNQGTAEDPTGMAAGSYTVTVTDANGCTAQTSVTITQPQAGLALTTTQTNVGCFGNNTGAVDLTVTGGTAPYSYLWSNNGTAEDPTGMIAGAYTVTVTDANGCTAQTSVTITQPQAGLALSTTQVNVLCSGNNTGSINLTVTGGTAPYTYAWSNNTTQEDPTGLASGTYTVTVTDANGCTAQTSVTITQPQAVLALSTTQVNVLCFGNSTGSVNLTVTGGTAPYTYAWSNNTTQEDPINLASGTYTVTVTDANGCTAQTSVTITQPQAPLALATTQVNVLCFGNSTGSIDLTPTGGTAPYTYAWSNNTTQEDPTGLAAGTYTVTVTDANGCTAQTIVTITQPQAPLALATTQVNVLCYGNSTGSINLTPTGGTAPYMYAWSNNTILEDPTGLASGTYTVTVTDANGCTAQTSVTITQPLIGITLSTTQINVACFGNSSGSINLIVAGGTPSYSFLWSNGLTLEDLTSLPVGTYSVIVSDNSMCIAQTSVTITQPQAQLALSTTQVNVLCSGNNTGSINLTVTGGTAPYTYAWSNNTTQEDPTNLASGTYTVTVTDANGCTSTTTVTITQPQAPLALATTQVNVLCFGNSTGSINLTVTGGTAPYTYAWSNNTTQEDPTNLASGTYTVTVTDANGCAAQTSVTITQPQAGLALSTTQVNVLCFGNSTGSVNLTVTGGTAPYTYLWSNQGTAEDPTGMAAGAYTVTVTDANGCTAQTSVTITQPQAGLALSTTQVNVLCSGNNTGSINLTVTGGTAPYTYAWSNNTTQEDPTGLASGTYTVTVTDANGCTSTTTVTITQPQAPLALATTQVNVLCFGNSTGSVNLTVTGGTAPYTYAWSNNTTQEDPTGLVSGTYSVTVTDANGCTAQTSVTITQPQAGLALSTTQVNVLCFGNSTGSVNLTVTGGTAPYTYLWSNQGTAEDPTGMAAGSYIVTVTDANGCTAQTSVTITQPQAGLALSTTQVNVLCFGNSTGSVNLTVTGGTAPYTYAWSNNTTQEDPTNLVSGTYTVTVTDANGCTAQTSVTITQPASAVSVTTQSQNILCLNGTGSVNSTPTGGVAPYTYSWSNNAVTQNITNLQAGTYIVTVQDANGCTASSSSTIFTTLSQLPVQILNITGTTILTCTTPTIVLQATGGVTYNWSGGSTPLNDTNSITQPGLYTVNMVDPNGCPVSQTITLTQNITPPTPGITNITGTTIIDCNAPSIDLQATGGGTYQWSNNLGTSSNVNITQAGSYTVVVTAANGCQDSSTVAITVAPVPSVTANDTTICSGHSVTLTPIYYPAGGQAIWTNGQLTPSITVSPNTTTMYSVLYTWNGCTATDDITVTVNPTPTLSVNNPNICFGDTTLLTATPNLPNGSYNWITTNETTQSISVHPQTTTTYSVSYTLNGCTSAIASSTVTVTPLPIITVPNISICDGSTGTLTATSNVAGGTYSWSQGGTTASITEGPQTTTSYNVSYTVNGCTSNTASPTITVNPLPNVSFTADTTSGCVPVVVNLTADTTGQQASYTWSSNGGGGSVGANAQMNFGVGGCYDVTLTATLNGCSYSVTQPDFVCVQDYPQASFEANPPSFTESTQMINFNNTSVGATGYVWNFGDGNVSNQEYPEHLFQGTNDGYTITLIASTSMGCMDSTSVFIDANLGAVYYIPNTFTPDGNQFNQTFRPVFTSGISTDEYEMLIYNRWGEIMFESRNIFEGWDGSYGVEGLDCPSGTYTYKIVCTPLGVLEQKQIITGHVNLLR